MQYQSTASGIRVWIYLIYLCKVTKKKKKKKIYHVLSIPPLI